MGNVKDKLILGRIKHRMQGNNRLHYQYELDTSTFFPCLPPFEGLQISFYDHWGGCKPFASIVKPLFSKLDDTGLTSAFYSTFMISSAIWPAVR